MDKFAQQIKLLYGRINALQQRADEAPWHAPDWLPIALEELQTALEELHVAEAELCEQNQELAAAREAVEVERQRYQDLFEFAPDGYLVTDVAGIIREANYAAARMLNVEQRFLIGKPLATYVAATARQAFRSSLSPLNPAKLAQEWEVPLQPRHSQPFDAAMTVAPVCSLEGKVMALRWLLRDITRRRQAEAQVRILNAELEQRVRDRTAQLEAANRMKDEFLATISHELRTPLNAVLGWARLLQTRKLDETTTLRALETIERNAKLQTRLVEELLDLSRMIQGKLGLNITKCELAPILDAAISTVCPAAEAKGIQLVAELDPAIGSIPTDPDRLQQVIWNLLSNAIKFTPQGGHIEVETKRLEDSSGSFVQIRVSDTGRGISPEFLPYIFDSFRQAEQTSTRMHGGLGLGLTIVRHLVELHGGTVQAESLGEDQGATFVVRLPLAAQSFTDSTEEVPEPQDRSSVRRVLLDQTTQKFPNRS